MNQIQGERFLLDLDEDEIAAPAVPTSNPKLEGFAVGEILERVPHTSTPPAPPILKNDAAGFPAHRKRAPISRFKQQNATAEKLEQAQKSQVPATERQPNETTQATQNLSFEEADRRRIDEENRQRLADMTPQEIEHEQRELFARLDPALIQKLLQRANISEDERHQNDKFNSGGGHVSRRNDAFGAASKESPTGSDPPVAPAGDSLEDVEATVAGGVVHLQDQEPTVADSANEDATRKEVTDTTIHIHDQESTVADSIVECATQTELTKDTVHIHDREPTVAEQHGNDTQQTVPTIHFPKPPEQEDLDPSQPDFLKRLHEKHFPNLAHDPSKLAWMQPAPEDDTNSPYHPSRASVPAADLRFNFRGQLLPPKLARQIPVSEGLHHHGDAPEAAGYTIPELARLSRSVYAPQRCIAYQSLGRILYRLGIGEFGDEADPQEEIARLSRGLWDVIEETKVTESMTAEARREKGHMSAIVYAQEAVWNWQRGGGRKRKAR